MPAIVYSESKIYLGRRLSQTKVWTPKYLNGIDLTTPVPTGRKFVLQYLSNNYNQRQ